MMSRHVQVQRHRMAGAHEVIEGRAFSQGPTYTETPCDRLAAWERAL